MFQTAYLAILAFLLILVSILWLRAWMRKSSTIIFGTLFLVPVGCFLFSLHNFHIYPYWEDNGVIEFMSPKDQWETAAFFGILFASFISVPTCLLALGTKWIWMHFKTKNTMGLSKTISE